MRILFALTAACCWLARAQEFTIVELPTPPAGTLVEEDAENRHFVRALNDGGQVLADTMNTNYVDTHKFVFDGHRWEQVVLPFSDFYAIAMNNHCQVAGVYFPENGELGYRPFLWAHGKFELLDIFPGESVSVRDINDKGEIVGEHSDPSMPPAFGFTCWRGRVQDLGTLGYKDVRLRCINQKGQIAVAASDGESVLALVGSPREGWTAMGSLGGLVTDPIGINDAGSVIGEAWLANDAALHPFLYRDGQMQDLAVPEANWTSVLALNNRHEVLGNWTRIVDGRPEYHRFLYRDGNMLDLDSLLQQTGDGRRWKLITASALNNESQIAGVGEVDGRRAFYILSLKHWPSK